MIQKDPISIHLMKLVLFMHVEARSSEISELFLNVCTSPEDIVLPTGLLYLKYVRCFSLFQVR